MKRIICIGNGYIPEDAAGHKVYDRILQQPLPHDIEVIYGGLAVNGDLQSFVPLILFAAMAFFSNTGREITKGIVDMQGDRLQKVKTLAVVSGSRTAAVAATSFYVVAVILSTVAWFSEIFYPLYLPFIVVADVGFIWSSISLLRRFTRENAIRVKSHVRVWMVMGLLAFVVGTFSF